MQNFTPYSALFGGVLIGLSAVLLLWTNGRIAGISGILNGALDGKKGDRIWRNGFLAGMIFGAGIYVWFFPQPFDIRSHFPFWQLVLAGFLVGSGTRLGNGCTSGHGVCGIARLSLRSILATLVFLSAGMITVFVIKHLLQG